MDFLFLKISNWQTPDDIYSQFEQTGCLSWIPDCK